MLVLKDGVLRERGFQALCAKVLFSGVSLTVFTVTVYQH
jgi:hypothetical protein